MDDGQQDTNSVAPFRRVDPRILIDGYNLLFQSQLVGKGRARAWLERARQRMLQYLTSKLDAAECKATQIIFDASQTEDTQLNQVSAAGITITFAINYPEADDLLEEIIRVHSHPKSLRVVSSDQRIRRRARARNSESIDSESFLAELEARPMPAASSGISQPSDQSPGLSDSEVAYWLNEFGHGDS